MAGSETLACTRLNLEVFLKDRLLGPTIELLIQQVWVGTENVHFQQIPRLLLV